jgi:5-methylcytosine-specific restriction endonuclease McrA|tara:strand:- start:720 stop:1229 length:510 start_codon:yes stop_codon:yes gene_type:complete
MGQVLLLNADAQPVSYLPLSAIAWKDAITYLWLDKVTVLEWYDDWMVHSATWETRVPAVIMLKEMQRRRTKPRFSKHNLMIRDLYTCQYCNTPYTKHNLTMDHVMPIKLGGKLRWDNIVAACGPCNNRKGSNTSMKPRRAPYAPDYWDLVAKRKQLQVDVAHPSWNAYL